LNLFLHVTGRREDGYHQLQTVFQLLDWGDTLQVQHSPESSINLVTNLEGVPPEQNLIVRAAELLRRHTGTTQGATLYLEKHIPMGGGLGGGSSNAATALVLLNHLWNTRIAPSELARLSVTLGADVPVFVEGHSAWGEGIGDELTPMTLPNNWFVILHPPCHVSTAKIFSDSELTRDTDPITMSSFFGGLQKNDLESIVVKHYPAVKDALVWLGQYAPAKMTGSGACVFAPAPSQQEAEDIVQRARREGRAAIAAQGINTSPLLAYHC
jgi:4-diphosphocytidyl-2-C-methyl-D-erythritol kinase